MASRLGNTAGVAGLLSHRAFVPDPEKNGASALPSASALPKRSHPRKLAVSSWFAEDFAVPISPARSEMGFENGEAVAVTGFDFSGFDSLEDLCMEALKAGRKIGVIIDAYVAQEMVKFGCELISRMLAEIITSKKPRKTAYLIAFAGGMHLGEGWNQSAIAKKLGVTKQDIDQGVDRYREIFELRKTRAMRSEEAKANMSKRNFRHSKAFNKDWDDE